MKTKINAIQAWIKIFAKKSYRFWFETHISEERLREIRQEHMKFYYPPLRM